MFKHLKYIDGNSDKFWEIETSGNSHTVTYGRNGTDGQSKTKTFDSEEACLKDAEKLINDKTKKGYSEDGTVNLEKQPSKDGKPAVKSASQQEKEELVNEFRDLVKRANADGIVPFLEKHASGNLELFRKELKNIKKYYMTYVDLAKEPQFRSQNSGDWGYRANRIQQFVIKLLALGLVNQTEANSWFELVALLNETKNPKVQEVLEYAKPTWIVEFLLTQIKRNNWVKVHYWNLRMYEEKGLVSFNPELYALTIPDFFEDYPTKINDKMLEEFCSDPIVLQRDIPLVFEYETGIQGINYNYDNKTGTSISLWKTIFEKLVKEEKYSKEYVLKGALEAQTKNWNPNLKTFFRELILDIKPEDDLLLKEQHAIFPLFHAEHTGTINFAISILKPLLEHKEFDIAEFLTWIEPVFMRVDMKGGVKTLIIQLDKLLKNKPELSDRISAIVADTFMIPDLQLQERAAKFLLKHQKKVSDPVQEKLAMYSAQMLGSITHDLKELMGEEAGSYSEDEILATLAGEDHSKYNYEPIEVERLVDEIKVPSDWNDILFLLGQFIHSKDHLDMEIFLNAWTLHVKDFPEDYKKQLEPYINKLKNTYEDSAFIGIFSEVFINYFHRPAKNYIFNNNYYSKCKTVMLLNLLLVTLQNRWRSGTALPLLSLPTHKPYWIDPSVLLDRILLYEEMREDINIVDMSIALSRTVRENLTAVEGKIEKVEHEQLREILRYALGFDKQMSLGKKNWFSKLMGKTEGEDDWIGLWATLARTHYPDAIFEEFDATVLKTAPFAVKPFEMELKVEPYIVQQMNWRINKKEDVFIGNQLQYDFPPNGKFPETFLYALDLFNRVNDQYYSSYIHALDVPFVCSITPQNTEATCMFYTVQHNLMAEWSDKSSKPLLEQMLYPFFKMNEYAIWYLATNFYNKDKAVRATVVELLIQLIEQNRLPTEALGEKLMLLLKSDYGPIGRMAEILEQCKDISSKHNQAILQILSNAFETVEVKDKMPTNFKKLVELFYDLQHKCDWQLSESLKASMQKMEGYKSLQPILKKILK